MPGLFLMKLETGSRPWKQKIIGSMLADEGVGIVPTQILKAWFVWCFLYKDFNHQMEVSQSIFEIPVVPHKAVAEVSKIGNL
jgi:hypothetical protein